MQNKTFLKPTFYVLLDRHHTMTVKDFFPRSVFITPLELNTLTNSTIMPMQYNNLKAHIRSKIGHNKHYDAIPSMNMPHKKIKNNITSLMTSIKKGSGKYRALLQKKLLQKISTPLQTGDKKSMTTQSPHNK